MDYENKPDGYYNDTRQEMLQYLPKEAKKVLDVGCGNGIFAASLKKKNTEVWGIELMPEELKKAESVLYKALSGPCEEYLDNLPNNYFDAIYFNDVLERLVDPYLVLEKIKEKLTKGGVIISSIPNIRCHYVLMPLFLKRNLNIKVLVF